MPLSTIEFKVNLTCSACGDKARAALSDLDGVAGVFTDVGEQRVVVKTVLPAAEVQKALESTGKTAVIVGMGGDDGGVSARPPMANAAAVAALGGALGAGSAGVRGVVRFTQVDADTCLVDGTIDGLTPGSEHALAIHESGDISRACESLGDHYNPRSSRHGGPAAGEADRHVGDLGNALADAGGRASFKFSDSLVKVKDVIGRTVAVSDGRDDLGQTEHPLSKVGCEILWQFRHI